MRHTGSLLLLSSALALLSCGSSAEKEPDGPYYPALSVIRTDLQTLDSLPVAVTRYREDGSKADTSIVEKDEFGRMALEAFGPDISLPPLSRKYREEVFMDRTLGRVVIRYATEDPDASIRLLEVTLDPDSEKVRSVYLEKTDAVGDTVRTSKSIWNVGRQFQTSVIRRSGVTPLPTLKERFVWGLPQ